MKHKSLEYIILSYKHISNKGGRVVGHKLSGLTLALSKNSSCYGRNVKVYYPPRQGGLGVQRLGFRSFQAWQLKELSV